MNTLYKCLTIAILIACIFAGFLLLTKIAVAPINISEAHEAEIDFITPELKAICACESVGNWNEEPRHLLNGNVLRGRAVKEDVGACQINEFYHAANAKKLGFNIYLWTGNVGYANYLYEKNGTKDWKASRACWDR